MQLSPHAEDLKDFHDALDQFAYERMNLAKVTPGSREDEYTTRLMLVVISALAKFAARWQPLISRVVLCLAKIARNPSLNKTVLRRATECMNILKFPR